MDLMSNKFLKIAKNILAKSLCDIFSAYIESKIFPQDFKIAKVTPIFKEDLSDELSNYHPSLYYIWLLVYLKSYYTADQMRF